MIDRLLKKRNKTRYQLSLESDIPYSTINDICDGKVKLENCSSKTVYTIACILEVPMEILTELCIIESMRESTYEYGLPEYLQHDLDAYKEGLKNNSSIMDCLWGELYGSINMAEINDSVITAEHADYLRKKYLF